MYRIANYSEDELRVLFRNTSIKFGLNEAIIEKDFWACLMLDYLFASANTRMLLLLSEEQVFPNASV